MDAAVKPSAPASNPLITPAMIPFFTMGEAFLPDCSPNLGVGENT
jgi:hypothetical protein